MKTKTLLPLAIILALPITAHATGPAAYSGNSPTVATASAPYQTVTPEAHADEHIASTQYVIGAYNDAIAAVNKVDSEKQDKFYLQDNENDAISSNAIGAELSFVAEAVDFSELGAGTTFSNSELDYRLVTASGVINAIGAAERQVFDRIDLQRAIVYTTWGDDRDSATQQVAFVTAQ